MLPRKLPTRDFSYFINIDGAPINFVRKIARMKEEYLERDREEKKKIVLCEKRICQKCKKCLLLATPKPILLFRIMVSIP